MLTELLAQGALHRHPRSGKRGGDRFGLQAPDAKEYLQTVLSTVFLDLEQLGFTQAQLRAAPRRNEDAGNVKAGLRS